MWVCPPPLPEHRHLGPNHAFNKDKPLHAYTRMQTGMQRTAGAPLEELKDWRMLYPELEQVLESRTDPVRCDIILLDAAFALMSDYPPPGSKLGINLFLDFANPVTGDFSAITGFDQWTCTTTIYQHGERLQKPTFFGLQPPEEGRVAPPFESAWWASTFTKLLEKSKAAEDGNKNDLLDAAEQNRATLRSLSAMQEIRASPIADLNDPNSARSSQRMAILLWRFQQAQTGYVGTTSWQRLIPPPSRMVMNSPPPPPQEMMPPMVLDSMVQSGYSNTQSYDPQQYLGQNSQQPQQYPMYGGGHVDEGSTLMSQNDFDIFKAEDIANFASFQHSFDLSQPQSDQNTMQGFQEVEPQHYEINRAYDPSLTSSQPQDIHRHPSSQTQSHPSQHPSFDQQPHRPYDPSRMQPRYTHDSQPPRDVPALQTHSLLQAQISSNNTPTSPYGPPQPHQHMHTHPSPVATTPTTATPATSQQHFAAASAMNDLSVPSHHHPHPHHAALHAHNHPISRVSTPVTGVPPQPPAPLSRVPSHSNIHSARPRDMHTPVSVGPEGSFAEQQAHMQAQGAVLANVTGRYVGMTTGDGE
ncbi:putative transcription factor [Phaeomoniella chlamydospora]|uniref:Putative transcription factor n=1 Tax=Phaeomoniella chlamydospora TaxID=158046 RepID=A0A0G2HFI6_PHACM|nr:putative transcription factor [Phaeomoniella chlamydospora]